MGYNFQLVLTLALICAFFFLDGCNGTPLNQDKPRLRLNSEGKFKIVNFADLHYGEYPGTDRGRAQDANSSQAMATILGHESPDFVVFTGDLMTGDAILVNSTGFIHTLLTPLVQRGYRWASTYGNHDNGVATTREQIFAAESSYTENCYTQNDATDQILGLTNYYLPIYPTQPTSGEIPVLLLWFFDSRGGFDPRGIIPSTVDETVVQWFRAQNEFLNRTWGPVPAYAYFHIPTVHYRTAQAEIPNRDDCIGQVAEPVIIQDRDTQFMQALVDAGTIMTTFVGHDHGNAWCCDYQNLEICYNKHTGYGGYGTWDRGARVIEFQSRDQRSNYIRMEDGRIIDEFIV